MSRIGNKIIALPAGVTVTIKGNDIHVKGPKGELSYQFLPEVLVVVEENTVRVTRTIDSKDGRARHGLTRQLVSNMIEGVSKGFVKSIEIIGVGYKAQIKGKTLVLNLGHSHPIDFAIPTGIEITQDEKNKNLVHIGGIDKQLVGQTAAQIREFRPPEPYKGKGIRYTTEVVRRKPGKTASKGS